MGATTVLIRPCTKPGCQNKTRGRNGTSRDYPTTLIRMKGGVCVECYEVKDTLCKGTCGAKVRPTSIPKASAPGTKSRHKDGMCKICWMEAHPETPREPESLVTEEDLEYIRRGLESFLDRRRERIERFAA